MSVEIIEEAVSAEFDTLSEVSLDTILYGKDFVNIVIQNHVESLICSSNYIEVLSIFYINLMQKDIFCAHVYIIYMYIIVFQKGKIKIEDATIKYYIYRLTQEGAATETMKCDSDELSVASHWLLPAQEFHYKWENLYYDCDIKNNVSKFNR